MSGLSADVRLLHEQGWSQRKIATKLGCTRSTVQSILTICAEDCPGRHERGRGEQTEVGYSGRHQQVYRARGKAGGHPCIDGCGRPAEDWSQVHGTDGLDLDEHWQPRCRRCHRAYDGPTRGEAVHGAVLTEADIREIRRLHDSERDAPRYGRTWTEKALATRFGTTQENIGCIVRRDTWKWVV